MFYYYYQLMTDDSSLHLYTGIGRSIGCAPLGAPIFAVPIVGSVLFITEPKEIW